MNYNGVSEILFSESIECSIAALTPNRHGFCFFFHWVKHIRVRQAVRHTLVDVNAGVRLPDGLTGMKHGAAIEWCNSAIRELKHHPSRPGCLFRDISSFLRPEFRELSGRDLMARSFGHEKHVSVLFGLKRQQWLNFRPDICAFSLAFFGSAKRGDRFPGGRLPIPQDLQVMISRFCAFPSLCFSHLLLRAPSPSLLFRLLLLLRLRRPSFCALFCSSSSCRTLSTATLQFHEVCRTQQQIVSM